jgi:hypothetical protein
MTLTCDIPLSIGIWRRERSVLPKGVRACCDGVENEREGKGGPQPINVEGIT